jgi:hypothetical protein
MRYQGTCQSDAECAIIPQFSNTVANARRKAAVVGWGSGGGDGPVPDYRTARGGQIVPNLHPPLEIYVRRWLRWVKNAFKVEGERL